MSSASADMGSLTAIAAIRQYAEIAVNETFILIVLDWFGKRLMVLILLVLNIMKQIE